MTKRKKGKVARERKRTAKWDEMRRTINGWTLGGPILLFFIVLGVIYATVERDKALTIIGIMWAYIVPPAGKETLIPLCVIAFGINWVQISLALAFMDMVMCLLIVWNFDFMKFMPILGPWLARFEKDNANIMEESRLFRELATIGLILFVFIPFQGSGGVVASVIGRIIGMKPWRVFSSVAAGAISGCLAIGYLADTVGMEMFSFFDTVESKALGILILGLVLALIYHLARRSMSKKRRRVDRETGQAVEEE